MSNYFKSLDRKIRIILISVLAVLITALMGVVIFSQTNKDESVKIVNHNVSGEEITTEPSSENTTQSVKTSKTTKHTEDKSKDDGQKVTVTNKNSISKTSGTNTDVKQEQAALTNKNTSKTTQITEKKSTYQSADKTEPDKITKKFEVGYNLRKNMLTNADESEKAALYAILDGIENRSEKINISDGIIRKNDTDKLSDIFLLVKASLAATDTLDTTYTYYGGYYVTALELKYKLTEKEISAQRSQLKSKINRIMAGIDSGMSDFAKVVYFHNQIVSYCKYTSEGDNINSAYGCLVEGKASCEGYAKAFLTLCDAAKLDCVIVTGNATYKDITVPHMWNKVKISGRWYNVDVCWDDPSTDSSGIILYDYLNVTDDVISKAHTPSVNRFYSYPNAVSESENYFVKNSYIINDKSDFEETVRLAAEKAIYDDSRFISVKYSDSNTYEYVSELLDDNSEDKIFEILNSAYSDLGVPFNISSVSRVENSELLTMTFILNS